MNNPDCGARTMAEVVEVDSTVDDYIRANRLISWERGITQACMVYGIFLFCFSIHLIKNNPPDFLLSMQPVCCLPIVAYSYLVLPLLCRYKFKKIKARSEQKQKISFSEEKIEEESPTGARDIESFYNYYATQDMLVILCSRKSFYYIPRASCRDSGQFDRITEIVKMHGEKKSALKGRAKRIRWGMWSFAMAVFAVVFFLALIVVGRASPAALNVLFLGVILGAAMGIVGLTDKNSGRIRAGIGLAVNLVIVLWFAKIIFRH